MPVLVEAISVIIRSDRLLEHFSGGWNAFKRHVPNETLCADDELVRVGFMASPDVEAYVSELESLGLRFLVDGRSEDLAVVDQQRGCLVPCDWLECRKVSLGGDNRKIVTMCQLIGGSCKQLLLPEGWVYEESLSANFGFVPHGAEHTLEQVADEDGLETFKSPLSDKPLYIGRTHSKTTRRNMWGWGILVKPIRKD